MSGEPVRIAALGGRIEGSTFVQGGQVDDLFMGRLMLPNPTGFQGAVDSSYAAAKGLVFSTSLSPFRR